MTATRFYVDSLAPTWLAADTGYQAALGEYLTATMRHRGYTVVEEPTTRPITGAVPAPVGMTVVRTVCAVEEFDIDMDDPAAGGWQVHETTPGTAHTVPVGDAVDHDLDDNCVCVPTPAPVERGDGTIGWVITHHSLDGREQVEASEE